MKDRVRAYLILFLFFLSIYAAIAFYATTPKPSQPFLGFGVKSSQGTLSGYTGPGSTVSINDSLDWKLDITNRIGSTQFIQIISRLGNLENQTGATPNATSPALLPVLTNSTLFIPDQITSHQNFTWKVTAVTSSGGLNYLTMEVNGRSLNPTLGNPSGQPFRLFFEIWTFNSILGRFQYYSWLQIWFRIK